jgi:NAD(P)-dependent dehydrogenase (short-subunit alcohol dehydrogenase family)
MQSSKNALVTGASRGIGRATAIELSKRGFRIAVHYNQNLAEAEKTLSELKGNGHFICQADLSLDRDIENLFETLDQHFAELNVVVNNAGIALKHPVVSGAKDWIANFRATINVNLIGAALVCHHALTRMISIKSGTIVNVSSRGAYRGEPDMPGYGASKAGLNSLTQSLAKAAGKHGIAVTAVAPGFVKTDMSANLLDDKALKEIKSQSPLNRIANSAEVARLIGFLCESDSKHLSGSVVDINGASYFR